jgi:hypothetical protein
LADYRRLEIEELRELVGERLSRIVQGKDGVDYDLTVVVGWAPGGVIRVTAFIGEATWGSPHDTLDETFVVQCPSTPVR